MRGVLTSTSRLDEFNDVTLIGRRHDAERGLEKLEDTLLHHEFDREAASGHGRSNGFHGQARAKMTAKVSIPHLQVNTVVHHI